MIPSTILMRVPYRSEFSQTHSRRHHRSYSRAQNPILLVESSCKCLTNSLPSRSRSGGWKLRNSRGRYSISRRSHQWERGGFIDKPSGIVHSNSNPGEIVLSSPQLMTLIKKEPTEKRYTFLKSPQKNNTIHINNLCAKHWKDLKNC